MLVLPAIDVSAGRLARLEGGRAVPVGAFGGDPLAAAAAFAAAGASWLHVVDMDHALQGTPLRTDLFSALAGEVSVQASGGLADAASIEQALAAGASRAVVASSALNDRPLVERLVGDLGDRVAIGLEVRDGRLHPRGGQVGPTLPHVLSWLSNLAVARLVFTAVGRVGTLAGPDLASLRAALETGPPVVVAGGVGSLEDVAVLRDLGAEGAIVGRACYEGLDLAEAIALAAA